MRRFWGWKIFRPGKCGTSLCGCSVRTSAQGSAALPCEDVPSELPHREVRHFPVRMFCQNFRTGKEVRHFPVRMCWRHFPVRMFRQNFRTGKCGTSLCGCSVRTSAHGSAALPCADVPSECPHREVRHFLVRIFRQNLFGARDNKSRFSNCQETYTELQSCLKTIVVGLYKDTLMAEN